MEQLTGNQVPDELDDQVVAPRPASRRPFALHLFFVLYMLVGLLIGAIAAGVGKGAEFAALTRVLLGIASLMLLFACAGIVLGEPWLRRYCIAVHVLAIVATAAYGIATWPEVEGAGFRQSLRIVGAAGFHLGCIGIWMRRDVVEWFAARTA